jgi:hypothetical protein
MQPALPRETLL